MTKLTYMTMKINKRNNHIAPELYSFYISLKREMGALIVHRRRRTSSTCIEIIFLPPLIKEINGRLNTLPDAEACGYWIMCRRQTKRGHECYHGYAVFQLFLTPVHPKKRNEAKHLAAQTSLDVSFEPIPQRPSHTRVSRSPRLCRFTIIKEPRVSVYQHVLTQKRSFAVGVRKSTSGGHRIF
ncbi:MAG: hypothetical protein IKP02_11150 [Paludibacteraceae bacterium]|nr:hypothetical protein [Paludibacteraceae bacterium]